MSREVYERLARHLEALTLGYPPSPELVPLLEATFSPEEAQVALAIPNHLLPMEVASLEEIASRCGLPREEVARRLEDMAARGVVFSATGEDGRPGYALLQVGYGMPQTYFWGGQRDAHAQEMARRVLRYFQPEVTRRVYAGRPTKTFRYSPASLSVEPPRQGVYPYELIEPVVRAARRIAVCYCPCRSSARILGRTDCNHSLEVCLKYDEMADFVISRGLGREIDAAEALDILKKCEEEGLVHMVDNAGGEIKHTCNCCGHYCWNVGLIRRRKVPRDQLMASYFIRQTDTDQCIACGACEEICPVEAVTVEDFAEVDPDWCIGCGVCVGVCPVECISITRRVEDTPPATTRELWQRLRRGE